jgi:hypothetical protein
MTSAEFYLMLDDHELTDELANSVFASGFDDSELTLRNGKAAVWVCHRQGEFTQLVREALSQAKQGELRVSHVEIENEVFA